MRPDWNSYFISLCREVARRATCPRKSVGCILVKDRNIISTGYNGSVSGLPHCTDVGCDVRNNHCESVIHAEANAIAQAAKNGVRLEGATAYISLNPCWPCFKLLLNAGIKAIIYAETYHLDMRVVEACKTLGIDLHQHII